MYLQGLLCLLFVSLVACTGPCAPKEDMLELLKGLHKAPSYATMPAEYRAMVPELIAEAQSCQLTAYIYTIGFHKVLGFLDSLTPPEAKFFYAYFSGHLKYERTLYAMFSTTTAAPATQ